MKRVCIIVYACACILAGCGEDDEQELVLNEFYPKKSAAFSKVVIYGKNFSTDPTGNVVTINGTEALVLQALPEVLHITVPVTATSGELAVTTDGKTKTLGSIEIVEAEGSWEQKATFPGTWRKSPASFSHNGYGYIGLGYDGQQFLDLWRYDPVANDWTKLNDATNINSLFSPFTVVSTFVSNNTAYVLCFTPKLDQMHMYAYDIEQDEWEWLGSDAPYPVTLFSSIPAHAVDGQGMFGYFLNANGSNGRGYSLPLYDIETNSWSSSASIPGQPGPVWFHDSKAFSFTNTTLYEYTIATDTWQQKPVTSFPYLINREPVKVALNESVYFGMGTTGYMLLGDMWKYTPSNDSWTPITPCPSIIGQPSFFTIDNKAYFVLGQPLYNFGGSDKNLATMMLTP